MASIPIIKTEPMELLSDKCSQPPLYEHEGFIVRPFDDVSVWVEYPSGEGMGVYKSRFNEMLDGLYREDF